MIRRQVQDTNKRIILPFILNKFFNNILQFTDPIFTFEIWDSRKFFDVV